MPNYLEELAKRGLKLREFAVRCGISATHAAQVFKGKANPSAETERKMREVLAECPWCHRDWPHPLDAEVKL